MKCFCEARRCAVSLVLALLLIAVSGVGIAAKAIEYTEYGTINEYIGHYEKRDVSFFDDVKDVATFMMDTVYQVSVFSFNDNDYSEFEKKELDETSVFYSLKGKKLFGCKTIMTLSPLSLEDEKSYNYMKSDITIYLDAEDKEQNYTILNSMAQVMRLFEASGGYSFIFLNEKMVGANELINYLEAGKEIESLNYSLSVDKFHFSLAMLGSSVLFGCTLDYTA